MVLLPLSPGMRFQVKSTVGPSTTEPPSGVPRLRRRSDSEPLDVDRRRAAERPAAVAGAGRAMTLAAPFGTGRTVVVPTTSRAATVRAPPPGPPDGLDRLHLVPLGAARPRSSATVRSLPLSVAWRRSSARSSGRRRQGGGEVVRRAHGPQPAWQARTLHAVVAVVQPDHGARRRRIRKVHAQLGVARCRG